MKKYIFISLLIACQSQVYSQKSDLAKKIKSNKSFEKVYSKGLEILKTGFNAGSGYQEVWIRDFNTFIIYSLEARPQKEVKDALLTFFYFQGFDGNIPDGYQEVGENYVPDNYGVNVRYDMPGYVFHKNTVETDQETSLIQAIYKYISATGDTSLLHEKVNGRTILNRCEYALEYLMNFRYNKKYKLIWGATTVDWGDVQPAHNWGVKLDEYSTPAYDIYDNAMFLIAVNNFLTLVKDKKTKKKWLEIYQTVKKSTRKHLWDDKKQKFRPHVYMTCSPFSGFDEEEIFYHGGTAVAIQADLLSKEEILASLQKMQQNVKDAGAQSIGLTVYPPYPKGAFVNKGMGPYSYQNGGDWTWFGARMITVLIENGFVQEAYNEMQPFVNRVVENKGFYEWYTVKGKATGSGVFRGSAGVLMEAIDAFRDWAVKN